MGGHSFRAPFYLIVTTEEVVEETFNRFVKLVFLNLDDFELKLVALEVGIDLEETEFNFDLLFWR